MWRKVRENSIKNKQLSYRIAISFEGVSGAVWYLDSIGFYRDFEQFKADVTKPDLGDVNADYGINSEDLVALRKYLLNNDETQSAKYPDVNIDTHVDLIDLVALKKSLVEIS